MQKRAHHEQHTTEQTTPFEADKVAPFNESVKFRKPGRREKYHDENENAVGNQPVAGEQSRENHRPENHRGDQPAEKHSCLRGRLGYNSRVGHAPGK
jgi:DNA segregation ATPase FtsK/SpoIIIE-like protein